MKKTLLVLGLAGAMLIPTQRALAIAGIGLNFGQDSYTIAKATYTNLFEIPGVEFTRTEMDKPLGVGVYLFIDLIPVVDLDLGFNLFLNKFDVTYTNPVSGQSLSQEAAWARTAAYLTIQRKLFKVPMFNVFAGGGLSFHASVPLLDKEFMEGFLGDANAQLNVEDLQDEVIQATGFHVELGARFKPLFIPFALNVKFRRTFVDGIAPGESAFSTITLGFGFQL